MSNDIQKDEYYLPGGLGSVLVNGRRREIIEMLAKKDGSTTLTIGGYNFPLIVDEEMPPGQWQLRTPKQLPMSKEEKYETAINDFLKDAPLPSKAAEIMDCISNFGCVVVHEPTGITGYSVEDVNEKLKRHYQKIIDSHLQFTHVIRLKK